MTIFEHKKTVLKSDQLSEFCRHIGAMCSAGVPLANAMGILQMGMEQKKMRNLYEELQKKMEQGNSFSSALAETGAFPELLLNMFRAAEAGGNLEETAKRMAVYYRKEHRMRNQIRSATLYPKILCVVSLFVILTIFLVVMPTVEPLFHGMELPVLTRILMAFSQLLTDWWYLGLALLLLVSVAVRILFRQKRVRMFCDRVKVQIPLIGKQYRIIYTARFARSESSLYSSGLPMVEGLEIAARTIGNLYLAKQFSEVIRMVQGGAAFSRAIESVSGFDKKLAPVIYVGEETGKLDEMLESIAEGYEYDAETALERLTAMVEPMLIVVMGVIIGTILLGIMMPMWSMYEYMV